MRAKSSLAAVLSLLLVSAPVSVWACGVSCFLRHGHSGCETARSVMVGNQTDTSMPADMNMGPDPSEPLTAPQTGISATPVHSMSMSADMGTASERFELANQHHVGTTAGPGRPKTVSCSHEACSQISVSTSPPAGDHAQSNSLHRIAIRISTPVNLWVAFHWTRVGTSPPRIPAADHLVTTLRI